MCAKAVTYGDDFHNMDGYEYDSIFESYDDYYRERPWKGKIWVIPKKSAVNFEKLEASRFFSNTF